MDKACRVTATTWDMPAGSGDRWPDDYERGRPGWPPDVVDVPGVPSAATVLELAAGTGKLTGLLVRRFERVIAVEPAEAMRRVLVARCPEAEALDGSAESIPLVDASADVVFAAECFHLFEAHRAVAELRRVLRPRGVVVLMWNLPIGPADPAIAAVEQFLRERAPGDRAQLGYDPVDLNSTRYESGAWRRAFADSPFEDLRETHFPNPQRIDREGLVAFFASMGWVGDLRDAERLPLLDELRSRLTAREYVRHWETRLHWTRLAA
jgi:SAM-dependent methyltransferase